MTYEAGLKVPDAFSVDVGLADVPQAQLFTHSFLSYGVDEARRRALLPSHAASGASPCLPAGYVSSTGAATGDACVGAPACARARALTGRGAQGCVAPAAIKAAERSPWRCFGRT